MIKWEEKDFLKALYELALSIELRPFEFWLMTPAEIADNAKFYFKRKAEEEKTHWKRTRWLAMWIVNVAGKSVKRDIKETELGIRFADEIVIVDPEERKRQALETALLHAKMSPRQIKRGKDGMPMIYGENN